MKSKINWILIVVILFIVLIIIGFLTLRKPAFSYKMTSDEIIQKYLKAEDAVSPENLNDLMKKNDFLLVDIRKPSDFVKKHLENAVNVPFADLLSEDYKSLFTDPRQKIIYANNESNALQAWMILTQIGYQNLKYLKGGYYAATCILEADTSFNRKQISDENLLYDFSDIGQQTTETGKTTVSSAGKTNNPVPVKPRKSQPSGGC
ncbi:MAG TPA: rhodanese-like domain-containing protein [Bacteroidia bacterium]|nr:rhodanese-like domain-containing protein [Bacteroidia bacterium]HRS58253.1 rhodanese-like domain-containing protein [Bacteroidia bacterium]HRU67685.1 rhodanese-like domain-containing protein [Bacteroidia bacterium]